MSSTASSPRQRNIAVSHLPSSQPPPANPSNACPHTTQIVQYIPISRSETKNFIRKRFSKNTLISNFYQNIDFRTKRHFEGAFFVKHSCFKFLPKYRVSIKSLHLGSVSFRTLPIVLFRQSSVWFCQFIYTATARSAVAAETTARSAVVLWFEFWLLFYFDKVHYDSTNLSIQQRREAPLRQIQRREAPL